MARYRRQEIIDLSNRLEARAASLMFPDQPNLKGDMKAAALLLRLMLQLSDVETVGDDPRLPSAH